MQQKPQEGNLAVADSSDRTLTETGERDPVFFEVHGKEHCNEERALGELLLAGILFCNERPYVSAPWTDDKSTEGPTTILFVGCNDVFAWGCADAENLPNDEIGPLYKMHRANEAWGSTRWCCIRRNEQPQRPVIDAMKKAGAWDAVLEALPLNCGDPKRIKDRATDPGGG